MKMCCFRKLAKLRWQLLGFESSPLKSESVISTLGLCSFSGVISLPCVSVENPSCNMLDTNIDRLLPSSHSPQLWSAVRFWLR